MDKLIKPINAVEFEKEDDKMVVHFNVDFCDLPMACDSDVCDSCNSICWKG